MFIVFARAASGRNWSAEPPALHSDFCLYAAIRFAVCIKGMEKQENRIK